LPKSPNTDIPIGNTGVRRSLALSQPVPTVRDLESIGVKWTRDDDNDDQLTYALTIAATASHAGCCLKTI